MDLLREGKNVEMDGIGVKKLFKTQICCQFAEGDGSCSMLVSSVKRNRKEACVQCSYKSLSQTRAARTRAHTHTHTEASP